jgi:hypothetical protein
MMEHNELTLSEAAAATGMAKRQVREMVRQGRLPASRRDGAWYVLRADLDALRGRPAAALSSNADLRPALNTQPAEPRPETPALIEMLREKDAMIARLQDERVHQARELGYLHAQLAERDLRLRLLEGSAIEQPARPRLPVGGVRTVAETSAAAIAGEEPVPAIHQGLRLSDEPDLSPDPRTQSGKTEATIPDWTALPDDAPDLPGTGEQPAGAVPLGTPGPNAREEPDTAPAPTPGTPVEPVSDISPAGAVPADTDPVFEPAPGAGANSEADPASDTDLAGEASTDKQPMPDTNSAAAMEVKTQPLSDTDPALARDNNDTPPVSQATPSEPEARDLAAAASRRIADFSQQARTRLDGWRRLFRRQG